jgi:hypothetical protein
MSVTLIHSTRLFPGAPYAYAAAGGQPGLAFTAGAPARSAPMGRSPFPATSPRK